LAENDFEKINEEYLAALKAKNILV